MNKHLVAAALLCSLLASCTTMIQGGEDDYSYVLDAKRLGNQAVDQVMAGQGESARSYFQQSTDVLARGVAEHSRRMAERADTMSTFTDIGTIGLTIAGTIAGMDAVSSSTTGTQQLEPMMEQFNNTLLELNYAMHDEIRSSEREARYGQQQSVDRDRWRSVVVSDRNLSRSIVRVFNNTEEGWCTGAFISPQVILTAAHCYNPGDDLAILRQNIETGKSFMIGDDELIPHEPTTIRGVWERNIDIRSSPVAVQDVALIVTNEPSQNFLPVTTRSILAGEKLMTLGYSGDLNSGYFLQIDYGCEVKDIYQNGLIRSNCITYGGNSGGPVITTDGSIAVVGVHSRGNKQGDRSRQSALHVPMSSVAEAFAQLMKSPNLQGVVTTSPFHSSGSQEL